MNNNLELLIVIGILLTTVLILFKVIERLTEKKVMQNFILWNIITVSVLCVLTLIQVVFYDMINYSGFSIIFFSVLGISTFVLCFASIFIGGIGFEKKQYWAFLPSIFAFVRLYLSG